MSSTPPTYDLRVDDLRGPQILGLLREHLSGVSPHTPPGSGHALDLDALRAPRITLWGAWDSETLAGCGALREIGVTHGEIKSMRTTASYLRRGVATAILRHIISEAESRGYQRLSLETGSGEAFEPALALYTKHGFTPCAPFGDYVADGFSVFLARTLP